MTAKNTVGYSFYSHCYLSECTCAGTLTEHLIITPSDGIVRILKCSLEVRAHLK